MFLKNAWYVAAWDYELQGAGPIGRQIIGEPVALYRQSDGALAAVSDRCPHRHAPLSMGRVEGDDLRCMYHGLKFGPAGQCVHVPGLDRVPPNLSVRHYPVVERDSWIWVWMGEPAAADPALIPKAWGLDSPDWVMSSGQIDYEADYQLINDNLTDLSHLDFVHETTLGFASGGPWSDTRPTITPQERGLVISRWFLKRASPGFAVGEFQDVYNTYSYTAPGIFIMRSEGYSVGTAEACGHGEPDVALAQSARVEQQAVTAIDAKHTRYLYATGTSGPAARANPEATQMMFSVIQAAFAEDKAMIEGQQRIQALSVGAPMASIPQDRAPILMRQTIERLIKAESGQRAAAE